MIKRVVTGNVFATDLKDIAFAINTEGYNDVGFAGQVSRHARQLTNTGEQKLGNVITVEALGKCFHGLVCHSLTGDKWQNAPKAIVTCLDRINTPNNEEIAVVLMGTGMIGQMSGADGRANVKAIHQSIKNCVLYTLDYSEKAVLEVLGLKSFM